MATFGHRVVNAKSGVQAVAVHTRTDMPPAALGCSEVDRALALATSLSDGLSDEALLCAQELIDEVLDLGTSLTGGPL